MPQPQQRKGLRNLLRRQVMTAPLLPALAAAVGVILGGSGWLLSIVALLVILYLQLWRTATAIVLCATVTWLHGEIIEKKTAEMRAVAEQHDLVQLEGTVEKTLRKGIILGNGFCAPRVLVRGETDLEIGERVYLWAEPMESRQSTLPGVFDAEAWRRGQGIAAEFYFVRAEERRAEFSLHRLRYYGLAVREFLAHRLMPPGTEAEEERQVLCALVLGAKERAEFEVLDVFRRGGCLHAFAVSGLHVGLFSGILMLLLRWVRCPVRLAHFMVIGGVGVYVLLTGASVPALRAYLLLVIMLGALLLRRRCSLTNAWSCAALAVLIAAPSQLYNAGFLLSFTVYAVLCMGLHCCMAESPWFSPDPYIPNRILTRWERAYRSVDFWLRGVVVVSLSAWLAATPISLFSFHTFNTWSVLTNIAITPVLPAVMFCGLLHLAVGWIPFLGTVSGWLAMNSASMLLAVVGFFGSLPAAWLPAALPAESSEVLVAGCGFGNSFTLLGNHGLLVNPGSESNVTFRTFPAVFHSGFTPGIILRTRPGATSVTGAELLSRLFPTATAEHVDALSPEGKSWRTLSGTYTLYPAGKDYPRRLADSRAPVICWEHSPEWRVLYVGNAPADAWYRMPERTRRAQVLILGKHPVQPLDEEQIHSVGASLIILLPGAEYNLRPEQTAPAAVIRMKDEDWLRLSPAGVELNGSQWSAP